MNHDLDAALRDLADSAARAHHDRTGDPSALLAGPATQRVRRRRRARAAAGTAVGLVAVTGLVLGGAALADRPDPQPAHTGTPTPTASPSPTAAPSPVATATPPAVLPTADPTAALGVCGSVLGSSPTSTPPDDRWTASVNVEGADLVGGSRVPVSARVELVDATGAAVSLYDGAGPRILVLKDGVVVATTSFYEGIDAPLGRHDAQSGAELTTYDGSVPLVSCLGGAPLPLGAYQVVATAGVLPLGDDPAALSGADDLDAVAAQRADDWRTVVGTPVDITVAAGTRVEAPPAASPADMSVFVPQPSCGDPMSDASAGDMFDVTVGPVPAELAAGDAPSIPASLTYHGPGRLNAQLMTVVDYWAIRDGVVVGGAAERYEYIAYADIGTGSTLDLSGEIALRSCDGDYLGESALPAGSYTIQPVVTMSMVTVRTGDGVLRPGGQAPGSYAVSGTPFPLTVR